MENFEYKSTSTLAKTTVILLALTAILNGLYALTRIVEFFFFKDLSPKDRVDSTSYLTHLSIMGLVSLLVIIFSYATPVIFLIWQFRAAKNLYFLNANAITNSPGWNVGWWFIPFASLVMPFTCINELVNGSKTENALDESYAANPSSTYLTGSWWFFYLAGGLIGIATAILAFQIITNPEYWQYFVISLSFSHSFNIIASVLIIKIIQLIDNSQETSYKLLGERNNFFMPPPPPTFE
jgi:Domain of unknown function (DUF4328)